MINNDIVCPEIMISLPSFNDILNDIPAQKKWNHNHILCQKVIKNNITIISLLESNEQLLYCNTLGYHLLSIPSRSFIIFVFSVFVNEDCYDYGKSTLWNIKDVEEESLPLPFPHKLLASADCKTALFVANQYILSIELGGFSWSNGDQAWRPQIATSSCWQ